MRAVLEKDRARGDVEEYFGFEMRLIFHGEKGRERYLRSSKQMLGLFVSGSRGGIGIFNLGARVNRGDTEEQELICKDDLVKS